MWTPYHYAKSPLKTDIKQASFDMNISATPNIAGKQLSYFFLAFGGQIPVLQFNFKTAIRGFHIFFDNFGLLLSKKQE